MNVLFIDSIFFIFTIFIFIKMTVYAMYEIRIENNLFGGICTIAVSLFSIVFVNIMVWLN